MTILENCGGLAEWFLMETKMIPHGNKDDLKDILSSDPSTAQFPIIRTVLSIAALHRFQVAKIDISGAYLQAKDIKRDIYVRPPASWMTFPGRSMETPKISVRF